MQSEDVHFIEWCIQNLSGSRELIWKEYAKNKIILLQLIPVLNLQGKNSLVSVKPNRFPETSCS